MASEQKNTDAEPSTDETRAQTFAAGFDLGVRAAVAWLMNESRAAPREMRDAFQVAVGNMHGSLLYHADEGWAAAAANDVARATVASRQGVGS